MLCDEFLALLNKDRKEGEKRYSCTVDFYEDAIERIYMQTDIDKEEFARLFKQQMEANFLFTAALRTLESQSDTIRKLQGTLKSEIEKTKQAKDDLTDANALKNDLYRQIGKLSKEKNSLLLAKEKMLKERNALSAALVFYLENYDGQE